MKNKIDLKILQATIVDLKNNPNACRLYGENSQNGALSISESVPGEKLNKFIKYLYDNNLIDANYLENDDKIKTKEIKDMNIDEILTKLTWIIRGDRFSSGLIYSSFKDGTLLKLLEKANELESNYKE